MAKINITPQVLKATLAAIGRQGSCVYSAEKVAGFIILQLCGDAKPIRYKLPTRKRKAQKTNTAPVALEK